MEPWPFPVPDLWLTTLLVNCLLWVGQLG